jgi:hypothetical protein
MYFLKNKKARLVFYNLAFLFLFLFMAEIVLRLTGIGYDNAAFEPDRVLHHVHKKNYSFVNDNPAEKEYGNISVRYDEQGCVSNPEKNGSNITSGKRIALIGDSFIEGLQVPFQKSLTGILQKETGNEYEIKNFAVGGYSPVIYYLQLQQIIPLFHPQKVIVFLYSNDVREDKDYLQLATYNQNRLTGINGGINPGKYQIIRNSYLLRLIRKFYMQSVFYFSDRNKLNTYIIQDTLEEKPVLSTPTSSYLDSIVNFCLQNKCELILSAIPSKYKISNGLTADSADFSMQCRQWAWQRKIKFIDLTPPFEAWFATTKQSPFFVRDIHFNEPGHALAARAVLSKIKE